MPFIPSTLMIVVEDNGQWIRKAIGFAKLQLSYDYQEQRLCLQQNLIYQRDISTIFKVSSDIFKTEFVIFQALTSSGASTDVALLSKSSKFMLISQMIQSQLEGNIDYLKLDLHYWLIGEWVAFLQSKKEIILDLEQIQKYQPRILIKHRFGVLSILLKSKIQIGQIHHLGIRDNM